MKADGGWTPEQRQAAIDAAHDYIVVRNSLNDPSYAPYRLRCPGFHRMRQVGLLHWRHMCGAEHDEAESRAALAKARGESATGGMEMRARDDLDDQDDADLEDWLGSRA